MIRHILKNSSILTVSNIVIGIFGVFSLSITGRALGVEHLGSLALIQAFVAAIDKLMNFQVWQAVIKFGTSALEKGNYKDFARLIKFGFLLDTGSAVVGTLVALFSVRFIGSLLGWDYETVRLAAIYSFIILFHVQGTPVATLRIFNRFKNIAVIEIVGSGIVLLGTIIAWLLGGSLMHFVMLLTFTTIIGYGLLICFSFIELSRRNYHGIFYVSLKGICKSYPGLWGFVWTTNLNSSVKMGVKELDTIIVGTILGTGAAGLYKVVKQVTTSLAVIPGSFDQVIYPELTRLWERRRMKEFSGLIRKFAVLLGGIGIVGWVLIVVLGIPLIRITIGSEFIEAYGTLIWYSFAYIVVYTTAAFQPAMLAMGKPHIGLYVHIVSTVIYFVVLYVSLIMFDIIGAGTAYIIYYVIWALMMGVLLSRYYSRGYEY